MRGFRLPLAFISLGLLLMPATGCVQRSMRVDTEPEGAVVWLNDREMGRTPFQTEFLWYGKYDVVCRKDGYQTLKTSQDITAPFWQFVPLDAITDFLPLQDAEHMSFSLKPEPPLDAKALLAQGDQMGRDLQSSEYTLTRVPATGPVKRSSAVKPTTRPATTGPAAPHP